MPAISETRKAYLAGLFDGEGCIGLFWPRTSDLPYLQVSITQKNKALLEPLPLEWGGSIYNIKSAWQWRIGDSKVITKFLEALYPYTTLRAREMEIALSLCKLSRSGWELTDEDKLVRYRLADKLVEAANERKGVAYA